MSGKNPLGSSLENGTGWFHVFCTARKRNDCNFDLLKVRSISYDELNATETLSFLGGTAMKTTLLLLMFSILFTGLSSFDLLAQDKEKEAKKEEAKKEEPKKEEAKKKGFNKKEVKETPKEEALPEFDQEKADLETIKSAGMKDDGESLLKFFQNRTVTDEDRKKIEAIISRFGSEDFDDREKASDEIISYGLAAVGLLHQAERHTDVEITMRCQRCLSIIEKVSTGSLSQAVARLLGKRKPEGTSSVLLTFLPLAEDELISDEIRNTLAAVAMKNGTVDPVLLKAIEDKESLRRGAAAEALARGGDKTIREEMKKFLSKETNNELKMWVAVGLVADGKDKSVVPEMINLLAELPGDKNYRAEEILFALAGENAPPINASGDAESRKKARESWLEWWKKNSEKIDLAKLDEREKLYGFTLIMEMDNRGGGGRILEVGPDGKERWKITGLQFPSDAQILPGNRILIAEQNSSKISEREINGKELWSINFNQPVNVQRLQNGNTVGFGRAGIVEWDRNRKEIFNFNRPEYDLVSGKKLRNGEYVFLTQRGQCIRLDKEGKQVKSYNIGRINYWAGMDVMNNGKLLITQLNVVTELDLASGQTGNNVTYNQASSCQRLPNGNTLVTGMNRMQVVELDRNGKSVWEYKSSEANFRPWRAKRR
jgi:hypothetical protein